MLRRYSPTVAVCAVCAVTIVAHLGIAGRSALRVEQALKALHETPKPVSNGTPDEQWQLGDQLRPPRMLATATFEAPDDSSLDGDPQADALPSATRDSMSTPAAVAKPLTPRRQEELAAVREVIEDEMPETSAEERDIWFDELKSLPAEVVRDLLQVRKQLRVLTPDHHLAGPGQLSHGPLGQLPTEPELTAEPVVQSRPMRGEDWTATREALEQAIAWTTQNLANAATPGYKRMEVLLGDAYDHSDVDPIAMLGRGCRIKSFRLDAKQGDLESTERVLDWAILGEGFFVLTDPATNEAFFTRSGHFTRTEQFSLGWQQGDRVLELQPRLIMPQEAFQITIQPDGTLLTLLPGQEEAARIGQLELARFADPSRLVPLGDGLFAAPPDLRPHRAVPNSPGMGSIQQHMLEVSNVDVEGEQAHRAFLESILKSLPSAGAPRTARETTRSPH